MKQIVSKTDYIIFRECPKNAWLKIHRPDLYNKSELSEFDKAIIETGNEVELVSRRLFPEGKLINGRGESARLLTEEYLSKKESVLFQPIFTNGNFFAALDILKFDPSTESYSIYEVKATNSIDEKVHLFDLAFQVNLLKLIGLKISQVFLIHLNSEYVRSGELNIHELFRIEDVKSTVDSIMGDVLEEMKKASDYLSQETEPKGSCNCIYNGRSNHCTTFCHSNPHVPEYSIHDIARIGNSKKKLEELVDMSLFNLHEIPDGFELSTIQRNQVDAHKFDREFKDKQKIQGEIDKLVFPLYFLDYETFPAAIPRFDGFSPYQQIPFQYSLHVVNEPDDEPNHHEFIFTDNTDPSSAIAASLHENIGPVGSVIVWHKSFECKINDALSIQIPSACSFLKDVNNRVFDLEELFKKQLFVHKDFHGSTSIKRVLPVLAPDLNYKDLEIHEGGSASQSWNKITTAEITQEEKDKIINDLKKYCERDTYAMYAIWNYLRKFCSC